MIIISTLIQEFKEFWENTEFDRKGPLKFRTPLEERESYDYGDQLDLHLYDEKTGEEHSFTATIRYVDKFPLIDQIEIHCIRSHPGIDWCIDRVDVLHYGNPEKDHAYISPDPGATL